MISALALLLPCGAAAVCVPGAVSSATLEIAGDDRYWAYLNGVTLTSCTSGGGGCYKSVATIIIPPGLINLPPADNVFAAYVTDNGGLLSGATWRLTINYPDCPAQTVLSDSSCTKAKYAGNVFGTSGAPPVVFPPGWYDNGYDDSAWIGSWSSPICTGICASCCSAWDNSMGTPWIWGSQTFQTNYQSDGFLFRQHFRAGDPGYCPFSAPPTPTQIGTVTPGTVTPAPSGTPPSSPTRTPTRSRTPSATPSRSPSPTLTRTPSYSVTPTPSATATRTRTSSPSLTPTPSVTPTETSTRTLSGTPSPSPTQSDTATESMTRTRTSSPSLTPTQSVTPTETSTRTLSGTPSVSPTQSDTATESMTRTRTSSPSLTPTQSVTPSETLSRTPTRTPTATPTPSPSPSETAPVTATVSPTASPSATGTPSLTPSPSPSPSFSASPSGSATPSISPTGTAAAPIIVSASVYNSAGEKVADLAQNLGLYFKPEALLPLNGTALPDSAVAAQFSFGSGLPGLSWDGKNSAGQAVGGGVYSIMLSIADPFGNHETVVAAVSVLRQAGGLVVDIFNSAGERVRSFGAVAAALGGEPMRLSSRSLLAGEGKLLIQLGGSAGPTLSWDGRGDGGQSLDSGVYVVQLRRQLDSKSFIQCEPVTLLSGPGAGLRLMAWPNPAKPGGPLYFRVEGGGQSGVEISVHNLAGELVGRASGPASGFGWTPGDLASGVYLARARMLGPGPRKAPEKLKFAILN